jgi:hypothetical protein
MRPSMINSQLIRTLVCISILSTQLARAQQLRLPDAKAGNKYSTEIDTEGGVPPLTWSVSGGEMPPGLRLSTNGKLEGIPTAARLEPYTFDLKVADSSQPPQSVVSSFNIRIVAPLRITGASKKKELRLVGVRAVEPSAGTLEGKDATDSSLLSRTQRSEIASASGEAVSPSGNADGAALATNVQDPAPVFPAPSNRIETPASAPEAAGGPNAPPLAPQAAAAAPAPAPAAAASPAAHAATCWTEPKTVGECGGPSLRTIVGFEQAGVSDAQSQQDFFFDLYYDRPLGLHKDPDLGPALRSWGNLRISSVPQQISTDVATFAAGFAEQVGQLKVNEVAQAFEFLGGIQYRLWASKTSYASSDPVLDPKVHNRVSANVILGGGVITPLSPKSSVQLFQVPSNQPGFFTLYPQATGMQYVAFTLPDRDRFFGQAYGGLRLMTHFIGDSKARPPETFDLTYGFNESVTGGGIRGGVMRLEGFVPIPTQSMSFVYLFGTGLFKPGARATIATPFLLNAAPSGTLPTDPGVVVITTPQADRDYYRVGVGIDLVDLVKTMTLNHRNK